MSGILENLSNMVTADDVSVIGNSAVESEIFLSVLRNECSSDEEFASILESCGTELALYGLLTDPELAMEAAKKVVVKDWKTANFNRVAKRTAIRMAMINNDPLYTKYKKYRDLLIEARDKIYQKYSGKAAKEAKKIIANARKKAGNMSSAPGKDIVSKIDKAIVAAETKGKK